VKIDADAKAAAVVRLRRAQGQLAGVLRMLEEDADCEATVTQLAAVSKAVDRAGFTLVSAGMAQCLTRVDDQAVVDRARLEKLFLALA
jgi:DNA-binding FrmR family transcriptional regulator